MPGFRSEACHAARLHPIPNLRDSMNVLDATRIQQRCCMCYISKIRLQRPEFAACQAADAAELTARQRDAVCTLRRCYLGNLAALAARRRLLTAQLQVCWTALHSHMLIPESCQGAVYMPLCLPAMLCTQHRRHVAARDYSAIRAMAHCH